MDTSYQQMKKSYDEAKDEQTKKMYADMLANMDKQRQEMQSSQQKEEPALAYNRQLLSKYENALNALTSEASKYEDKPGDAQKSMEQYQKDMTKAVEDAKKGQ
jgi:molecular chaperone GrpE (heat shock protein)